MKLSEEKKQELESIYQKLMTDQNFINFLSVKDYKKCYKVEKEWKPIDAIEWLKNKV